MRLNGLTKVSITTCYYNNNNKLNKKNISHFGIKEWTGYECLGLNEPYHKKEHIKIDVCQV